MANTTKTEPQSQLKGYSMSLVFQMSYGGTQHRRKLERLLRRNDLEALRKVLEAH